MLLIYGPQSWEALPHDTATFTPGTYDIYYLPIKFIIALNAGHIMSNVLFLQFIFQTFRRSSWLLIGTIMVRKRKLFEFANSWE